jgi:hypothetical protein
MPSLYYINHAEHKSSLAGFDREGCVSEITRDDNSLGRSEERG